MAQLVEAIKNFQTLKGLSDNRLSQDMGISPTTWSKIKNGLRPPGGKFLRALVATYPQLQLAVLDYMSGKKEAS